MGSPFHGSLIFVNTAWLLDFLRWEGTKIIENWTR